MKNPNMATSPIFVRRASCGYLDGTSLVIADEWSSKAADTLMYDNCTMSWRTWQIGEKTSYYPMVHEEAWAELRKMMEDLQ